MSTAQRQRIRVCLKAYDHKLIDVSAEKIVPAVQICHPVRVVPAQLETKKQRPGDGAKAFTGSSETSHCPVVLSKHLPL